MATLSSRLQNGAHAAPVALVFGLVAAVYVWEAPAQPAWGDGIGFLYWSAAGLDLTTNATAHVLYGNLGYGLARVLPFWPNAGVLVGLSVVSALAALGLVYRLLREVASRAGALFGVGVLALSFTFWRHAVTIEVYAFNLAFVALVVWWAVRGAERQDGWHTVALAAVWGLSLLVHIQNVLLAPLAIYYLWRVRPSAARLGVAAGAWALAAIPLVVLPLVLGTHGLAAIFVDSHGASVLRPDLAAVGRGGALSVGYLVYNLHVWLVPVGVGAVRLWRERPVVARTLALVVGAYWMFAVRFPVSDSYVFYLAAYVGLAPCAAVGFDALLGRASARARWGVVAASLVVGPALYATAVRVARATPMGQRVEAAKGYKGGLAFYLYPGMRGAPDPLRLARTGPSPPGASEWNVEGARRFLDLEAAERQADSRRPRSAGDSEQGR